jgi:hypothetical protein
MPLDPKVNQVFRDFIPEGMDPGAEGSGFKDFVPEFKELKNWICKYCNWGCYNKGAYYSHLKLKHKKEE